MSERELHFLSSIDCSLNEICLYLDWFKQQKIGEENKKIRDREIALEIAETKLQQMERDMK